jgi:hypothetical protein
MRPTTSGGGPVSPLRASLPSHRAVTYYLIRDGKVALKNTFRKL